MLEITLRVCLPSWTLQIPGPQDVSRSALRQWTLRQEPSTSVSAFPLSSCVLLNRSESSSPNMDKNIYITGPLGRVNEIVNSWMLCKIQEFYRNWGCIILFISNRFSHRFPSDALWEWALSQRIRGQARETGHQQVSWEEPWARCQDTAWVPVLP